MDVIRPESPLVPAYDEWFVENPTPAPPCRCEPDDRCGRCEDTPVQLRLF